MAKYLVAIHHPDNYDPSVEDAAMTREIDARGLAGRVRDGSPC